MKWIQFISACVQITVFALWSWMPIDHTYRPTGNVITDSVLIPVGGISLVFLVIFSLAAPFEKVKK
jgi:hypothetical protein